jgi:hypothetical protein
MESYTRFNNSLGMATIMDILKTAAIGSSKTSVPLHQTNGITSKRTVILMGEI